MKFKDLVLSFLSFIFIAVFGLAFPAQAKAGGRLYFNPASGNFTTNNNFTVELKIDPGNEDLVAVDAIVNFDSAKLEVVSVEEVTYFSSTAGGINQGFAYNIENDSGEIAIYSFANKGNFSVNTVGTIAKITFKAKASGTAAVTLVCSEGDNSDSSLWSPEGDDLIDCAAVGSGSYVISGGSSSPTNTPGPTATPGGATSTPTPTALPETGIMEPLSLGIVLGGILLGIGILGLFF